MKDLLRFLWSLRSLLLSGNSISYSQCGEDLILAHAFKWLGIAKPTYLDIGAFHPKYMNNTYLFYKHGCRGVCVEPEARAFRMLKLVRRRDICLNVGVGVTKETVTAPFYLMTSPVLNTFSEPDARRYASYGVERIETVTQIPLVPVNELIEEHFASPPNFVSIDVEGLDLQILKTLDFTRFRPEVFCVETVTYSDDNSERKLVEINQFMESQDYFVYADTYINSIFVDKHAWARRGSKQASPQYPPPS